MNIQRLTPKLIKHGRKLMEGYVKSVDALSDMPTFQERCNDAEAHWPKLREKREEALSCALLARELRSQPERRFSILPFVIGFSIVAWITVIVLAVHFFTR